MTKLFVKSFSQKSDGFFCRNFKFIYLSARIPVFRAFISSKIRASSHSSFHSASIENYCIQNIEAVIRHYCNNKILNLRSLIQSNHVHCFCFHQRFLWVMQKISFSIASKIKIACSETLCLLEHFCSVKRFSRHVVFEIRNHGTYYTQNCCGINFQMRVLFSEFFFV